MRNTSFIFFGTDHFSVFVLEELHKNGYMPKLLVAAPDRRAGRGMHVLSPPTKKWAVQHNVSILQPETLDEAFQAQLESLGGFDLIIVASYGKIIPKSILEIPIHGALNVHPSLLPKYRGASPIESQILSGDQEVGVTIMLMDDKMDHGPILSSKSIDLNNAYSRTKLEELLAREGGHMLSDAIPQWIAGTMKAKPQNHKQATFTKKVKAQDAQLNPQEDSRKNYLKILAFDRSPRAFFFANRRGKKIRVVVTEASFKEGVLHIERVIPEGKKEMSYNDFLKGGIARFLHL